MRPTLAEINISYRSAIVVCGIAIGGAIMGKESAALTAFLITLPMLFWRVSSVQRQTLEYAESLERRLQAIERPAEAV
jgi:hypothetical protein